MTSKTVLTEDLWSALDALDAVPDSSSIRRSELSMRQLLLSFFLILPCFANAQELHTFSNGEVADAEKINENFEALSMEIERLDNDFSSYSEFYPYHEVIIDCEADSTALSSQVRQYDAYDRLKLNIQGECVVSDWLLSNLLSTPYRNIWLAGQNEAGGFTSERNCSGESSIKLHEGVGHVDRLRIDAVSSSLWLSCTLFDASQLEVRGTAQAHIRFGEGVKVPGKQPINVKIELQSTFRTYADNQVTRLELFGDSLGFFGGPIKNIAEVIAHAGSMVLCKWCYRSDEAEPGAVDIYSLNLYEGSTATFYFPGSDIFIGDTQAHQRSQINIRTYSNPPLQVNFYSDPQLSGDSAVYEN